MVLQGDAEDGKGDEDLKVAKLKTDLRESKTKIILLEAQVQKLEAQLSSAKVAMHIPPHTCTWPCMIVSAFLVYSDMCCSCVSCVFAYRVCARAECTRMQEIAVLEYKNTQKEEMQSLTSQVQAAYDKGYDKAVETITRFQNLRPQGPPSSALSSASSSIL